MGPRGGGRRGGGGPGGAPAAAGARGERARRRVGSGGGRGPRWTPSASAGGRGPGLVNPAERPHPPSRRITAGEPNRFVTPKRSIAATAFAGSIRAGRV